MAKTLENTIRNYFETENQLSREELVKEIINDFPNLTESTITVYLSKFKKAGIINNPSRGIYTISNKPNFKPEINQTLKKYIIKFIQNFRL